LTGQSGTPNQLYRLCFDLNLKASELRAHYGVHYPNLGTLLQGVLMEYVSPDYADYLHTLPFNPYSQYCVVGEHNKLYWHINTLTNEAAKHIIEPLRGVRTITLKKLSLSTNLSRANEASLDVTALTHMIHVANNAKLNINLVSPTTFKSKGEYQIFPTVRLLFQNLLMRYSQVFDSDKEVEPETIDYIEQHAKITSYNLRSSYFELNGGASRTLIPAFVGSIVLTIKGPQQLIGLLNMLCSFAEYSGIGVKTSMGMGGAKLVIKHQEMEVNE
jgi:CRISPR-associated endoribonuclease Cas6